MSEETIKTKYLNSFTILSYNPTNFYVTFKKESLLLNNDKLEDEITLIEDDDTNDDDDDILNNEEFWIIDDNGKNSIIYGNMIDKYNQTKIKAGPFFSMDLVVFYLKYFNEIGI